MCLGVPGEIIAIEDTVNLTAIVEISGVRRQVNLACVLAEGTAPESLLGTWVLVHVGFAMSILDADEAQKTLELLSELDSFAASGDIKKDGSNEVR